ncbi:porin [Paraburkholderia sp.]|uniref:porin n=1 Tax=Paraburkholderia sp. TaxID=1926495 RepID=UPI0039E45AF0
MILERCAAVRISIISPSTGNTMSGLIEMRDTNEYVNNKAERLTHECTRSSSSTFTRRKSIGVPCMALAIAAVSCGTSSAHAQSSVTLYGLIDVAVYHQTGVAGGSETMMSEGALQGSRFGLKGAEELGGGWKAIFTLENGFAVYNGKLGQQGQLFGRQAFVGLSYKGSATTQSLTFGRQYTAPFLISSLFDALQWANPLSLSWPSLLMGCRFDNTIQYSFSGYGINTMLQYSVGGTPGSVTVGSTLAGSAMYSTGPFTLGGTFEKSRDANDKTMNYAGIHAGLSLGNAKLYAQYLLSLRDPDFTPGASGTTTPLANASLLSNAGNPNTRRDGVIVLGASYLFVPALQGSVGFFRDHVSGAIDGGRGDVTTVYSVLDYLLSKRTDVYVEAAFTRLSGAEINDKFVPSGTFNGGRSSTQVALGLRTRF